MKTRKRRRQQRGKDHLDEEHARSSSRVQPSKTPWRRAGIREKKKLERKGTLQFLSQTANKKGLPGRGRMTDETGRPTPLMITKGGVPPS